MNSHLFPSNLISQTEVAKSGYQIWKQLKAVLPATERQLQVTEAADTSNSVTGCDPRFTIGNLTFEKLKLIFLLLDLEL